MGTQIFVYGTLKRGKENHGWMAGQTFVGTARTQPCYRLYDLGGYPGMVADENGVSIEGEIWEVDEAGLTRLDILEDVAGGEYVRERIPLLPPLENAAVEGYRYLLPVAGRRDVGPAW